eukprot:scaffold267505_cov39-Tisochrysis_lutea.AAC.1
MAGEEVCAPPSAPNVERCPAPCHRRSLQTPWPLGSPRTETLASPRRHRERRSRGAAIGGGGAMSAS